MYESGEKAKPCDQPKPRMSTTQPSDDGDVELTNEHFRFLQYAGASREMLTFLKFDEAEIGVGRSGPKRKLTGKASRGELSGSPETFSHGGSHFFTELWNGNLWQAWIRADSKNKLLMMAVFDEEQIRMGGLHSGEPIDYVNRMIEDAKRNL
jgi:hypothetical protein